MHLLVLTKMARILFLIASMLVTWGSAVSHLETSSSSPPSASPRISPSGDCSEVIYNLADCFDFLTKGSNYKKPSSHCCSGFDSVVKTNVQCICEAVRSSSDLGLNLNVTRVISLSSVCGISAPPFDTCDMTPPKKSPTPSPSPLPPKKSPTPSPSNPPAPAPSSGETTVPSPAPSPHQHNGAACSTAAASITVVIFLSMLVASIISV